MDVTTENAVPTQANPIQSPPAPFNATPQIPGKKPWVVGSIILLVLLAIFLIPLPYYEAKQLTCPFGPGPCPTPGWRLNPSIFQSVLLLREAKQVSTRIITPSPSPTPDPTANWKTYTNEDYGFSFSYPKELTYVYDHLKGGNISLQNFDGSSPRKELDSDFQMVITADDTNPKPLGDYPKQWETELGKRPTETISVGGITAIKGFSGQKFQAVPTIWFSKNATTFMIQLSHPKSTNKIWFDQILSTFQFTDQLNILSNIVDWTKPMTWTSPQSSEETYAPFTLAGTAMTSSPIASKADNKMAPLLSGDNSTLVHEGWILDPGHSGSGVSQELITYKKGFGADIRVLVIRMNGSTYTVFLSNAAPPSENGYQDGGLK